MVIALAGRRIDAPQTETPRFPLTNVLRVQQRIADWLAQHDVHTLVCSAACGTDLLALATAEEFSVEIHIVLPFPREQFRTTSVVDRGEGWGGPFDAILDRVEAQEKVIVLGYTPENEQAYLETNHVILELAVSLGAQLHQSVKAVVVWDGASRGHDDVTASFQQEARARGLEVAEISTL